MGKMVHHCAEVLFVVTFNISSDYSTVLPAKSDSGIMFCLLGLQDLESIDHLCINPIRRYPKWSVQVNVLLNNCKQNTTSLSLLAGRTVY